MNQKSISIPSGQLSSSKMKKYYDALINLAKSEKVLTAARKFDEINLIEAYDGCESDFDFVEYLKSTRR
jgi:hypothetical protein